MTESLIIDANLKRLRLPGMARHYAAMAREAETKRLTHPQYLLALSDLEIQQRDENMQRARVQQARFPMLKTLEQFEFSEIPNLNQHRVLSLAQGDYLGQRENLIMVGRSGLGKTHLAIALGICACRQGYRVRFVTASGLTNELQDAAREHRLARVEAAYLRYDLLIIDELGYIPFARDCANLLFTICAARYERRSTLVTTNLEFKRWPEVVGDQTLAGALVDRLTHQCHVVPFEGDSYRLRQSLKRLSKQDPPGSEKQARRRESQS